MNCSCTDTLTYPVIFKNGITHIKVECADCGKFLKWQKKPSSDFTLWFGKHKGKCLKEVPLDYLKWLKNNNSNEKLVNRINEFLSLSVI